MEYDFRKIEEKWRTIWREKKTYTVSESNEEEKFYVLDMFPYPSGAGLHVGHPLGYIASDIYARYKRHLGFNVLHPMGYDSFGLPAEQYAIQTGQHPATTTAQNIARYREQLDKIGFSYDWSREVQTSDPGYYRWTQWIFSLIFDAWYNNDTKRAEPVYSLIERFKENGNYNVNAAIEDDWYKQIDRSKFPFFSPQWSGDFSAADWCCMNEEQQQLVLMQYRLAYLADSVVNWCPALGTVLANDEIKDGVSERGGYPVEQKKMRQWSMRISAYAERLLEGLERIDWSESIKEVQRNWIGRSEGAILRFAVDGHNEVIRVFTTRPDTLFGVSFLTLAPEHDLVVKISTAEYKKEVENYIASAKLKSERDRQSEVKNITGQFTGAYAIHPFTGEKIPVWISEYVLSGYGTGAIMAVPAGDQRDYDFAKKFDLPILSIFEGVDLSEKAETSKESVLSNSQFLNGLTGYEAIRKMIAAIREKGIGEERINYRIRDAVFSRQRYWGEPFPIFYKGETPYLVPDHELPVLLPAVDKYLPTESGDPPLARAENWEYQKGADKYRFEYNTMPGWAGSSWYFLRYMDSKNKDQFASREKTEYWNQVDLYVGGAEHGTGHLLYSRFWTKVLYDLGYIGFDEPFKKMINQGMILGKSSIVYRIKDSKQFVSADKIAEYETQALYADISMVNNDQLDIEAFKKWRAEYSNAEFILNDEGKFICGSEIEKISKSKFNVQTPDELVEKFGADTLRCYEMFLGPLEQSKPWDINGITGVHHFLKKFWRLFHNSKNIFELSDEEPSKQELKTLHKTIKKVTEELNRFSWNTVVSALMIGVNELQETKCNKRSVLEPLCVLLSPYAPHISEELWQKMRDNATEFSSITTAAWPPFCDEFLQDTDFEYPVSFNGKTRFFISLPTDMRGTEIEKAVLAHEQTGKYLDGKSPKKIIVVPKRIVNVVV
ncbi:MAG: leucine--tRNA ligase [Crocinitomicaceae bacterium]|nr:leucine--tRNA ligase [Crocinitomicaceae bacterium]